MFFNILKFELAYRSKRPATYIYFVLMFLLGFLVTGTDVIQINGGAGQIKVNAPSQIALWIVVMMAFFGMFMISAIMGVPVLRDFQHKTDAIYFTRPIKKFDYLFGRFTGSFIVTILVCLGMLLGFMLGPQMPWVEADKVLPFNFYHYFQPFLVFILPSILFMGALFFMGGTLSRSILFVYVQGVFLLAFYLITNQLLDDLDNRTLAALIDPFGINTVGVSTQYWTVVEQNSQIIPLKGLVLQNRLIWGAVGIITLLITYFSFSFKQIKNSLFKRKKKDKAIDSSESEKSQNWIIPEFARNFNLQAQIKQTFNLSWLYYKEIAKSFIFIAIVTCGMVLIFVGADSFGLTYGADVYPMTYAIINLVQSFNLFFLIIIIFFGGELIWKERDIKMNLIYDSLPIPNFVGLISKFLGFLYIHISLLFVLMLSGILIQAIYGYFEFELPLYFKALFGGTLSYLILFTLLSLFIQIIVNHKFLGYALMITFYTSTLVMGELGIEHSLFRFASGGMGIYSDMNSFGHFLPRFSWLRLYWYGFVLLLFSASVLFAVRGTDTMMQTRTQLAKLRFSRPLMIFGMVSLFLFIGSGCFVFYNTNVINKYANSDAQNAQRANYEKKLKQYEYIAQPKIESIKMKVDLFPYERKFNAEGTYFLKNKTQESISDIHIQLTSSQEVSTEKIEFDQPTELKEDFPDLYYRVYELKTPLLPGDSISMTFSSNFGRKGFVEGPQINTEVVFNGTFFWNSYYPSIGYQPSIELGSDEDRKDHGLEPKERMLARDDERGHNVIGYGKDADRIDFEIELSTAADQIAIAPGYLQTEPRVEGDRRYFHYKMDAPMINLYSIVSGRYEVMREKWNLPNGKPIDLEIYYHEGHEYNLDRMMKGMKKSLAYFSENFSPYQYRQMRIIEFPRYQTMAASFANTVPFSEGIGFIMDIDDEDEESIDVPFYVTAHEMAHQWWAHQVAPANVQGGAMLNESMSQYSALMVMKHEYPAEKMRRFLRHELQSYLLGRRNESKKEMPLELVEGQGYIHYQKGSLIMYAFQDYVTEDSVNAALKRYVADWAWREDRYVTTDTLISYFREITPDSLQYIITDMFETITLFENRVVEPTYEELDNGSYQVNIPISAVKYRADSLGNETAININDWIDIGVYTENSQGKDSLLYLKKHKINQENMTFEITVDHKPTKAGIDPINKLIDRNPDDNTDNLEEKSEEVL